jgi:hypothetical protein
MFGLGISEVIVVLAILVLNFFWIFMLIHALVYQQSARHRVFWVLVIFFTWFPGAAAYAWLRDRYPRDARGMPS